MPVWSHWNKYGRLYRMTHAVVEIGCTWCGDDTQAGNGTWIEPATEGGEYFCSLDCLNADTFQCWDHDPADADTFDEPLAVVVDG